jgi:hypothetical protein
MITCSKFLVMVCSLFMFAGCASLLPTSKATIESPWQEFDSAKVDYGKIFPGTTTMEELNQIGFDPYKVPNIRILNATDTINIFLSNPSIRIESLDPGVQKCFEMKARCTSYRIEPSIQDSKRIGNFWLDLFTFKRHTVLTGWEFRGLIILVDDVVVYKDPLGGRPTIHTEDLQIKPLGPLQDAATIIPGVIQSVF